MMIRLVSAAFALQRVLALRHRTARARARAISNASRELIVAALLLDESPLTELLLDDSPLTGGS